MKFGKIVLIITIVMLMLACIALLTVFLITKDNNLNYEKLDKLKPNITVSDINGEEIDLMQNSYVSLNEISPFICEAFVALEDKRFYSHSGIDYRRIVGALVENVKTFSFKEGGSTITQQLIKNTHLSGEKTIKRKLVELKLSNELEENYTKDEILEMYLNIIYFGNSIYGVNNACRVFFDKSPENVNVEEAATLAGIVKNPKAYSPLINYEQSLARRNLVLRIMSENNYISKNSLDKSISKPIVLQNRKSMSNLYNSYIVNVMNEANSILKMNDGEIINGGYRINTYLDKKLQLNCYNRLNSIDNKELNIDNLLMSVDNATRGVKAYCSTINNIDSIMRQAGSSIKPFAVYAPALELNLISPATQVLDEPININGYAPSNYGGVYNGYVSARQSLAHSYNVPAVKLMQEIGLDSSIEMLQNLGIDVGNKDRNLSLALGSVSVTPRQLIAAYSTLANGGKYNDVSFIKSIVDKYGNVIYNKSDSEKIVWHEDNSYILTDMLMSCVSEGTAKKLSFQPFQIAAKTGTVGNKDGNTDAWCAAYTAEDTFLSWMGAKDGKMDIGNTGGGYPCMLINNVLNNMDGYRPSDFEIPSGVYKMPIDMEKLSQEQIIVYSQNGKEELFNTFTVPKIADEEDIVKKDENKFVPIIDGDELSFWDKLHNLFFR